MEGVGIDLLFLVEIMVVGDELNFLLFFVISNLSVKLSWVKICLLCFCVFVDVVSAL